MAVMVRLVTRNMLFRNQIISCQQFLYCNWCNQNGVRQRMIVR